MLCYRIRGAGSRIAKELLLHCQMLFSSMYLGAGTAKPTVMQSFSFWIKGLLILVMLCAAMRSGAWRLWWSLTV